MIQGEIDKIVALAAAVVVWRVASVLLDLLALGLASLLPSVIAAKRLARVDL